MVLEASLQEKVTRFGAQVSSLGGHFTNVLGMPAVREYVTKLASTSNAMELVLSSDVSKEDLFSSLPVQFKIATRSEMTREAFYTALKTAKIGITNADVGVAETGTIIIATSDESDRLVSALPEIHVALLPGSRLVSSLQEAEPHISRMLNQGEHLAVSLISASSRTSDIGGLVVLGVHGPKELHVLLVDELPGDI